jgi:hypothetical protein
MPFPALQQWDTDGTSDIWTGRANASPATPLLTNCRFPQGILVTPWRFSIRIF